MDSVGPLSPSSIPHFLKFREFKPESLLEWIKAYSTKVDKILPDRYSIMMQCSFSYQHVHHDDGHSKNEDNKQNIGERGKGKIIPWKEVVVVVHFTKSHHKHGHHRSAKSIKWSLRNKRSRKLKKNPVKLICLNYYIATWQCVSNQEAKNAAFFVQSIRNFCTKFVRREIKSVREFNIRYFLQIIYVRLSVEKILMRKVLI